jgi:carboxylate-amine ligase
MSETYRFAIKEQYFLVDAESKSVARSMPQAFQEAVKPVLAAQMHADMLPAQIEVATRFDDNAAVAGAELRQLRQTLARIAAQHGLAILAAGTHPTATELSDPETPSGRYDTLLYGLDHGQRSLLCGLNVQVELPDPDDRIDVMIRMLPYLPLFVALATSSPFWRSRPTGLKGYRLAAFGELPRTGIPELFRTAQEYRSYLDALIRAGVIENSSGVWWAIRPSLDHLSLELRAPDCCTRVEDSVAIAALYRALARRLVRNPWLNWDLTPVSRAIVVENNWRAQRYGVTGTFVDEISGAITVGGQLDHVLEQVRRDADALGCVAEVEHCRKIVSVGTSADAQLAVFEQAQDHKGRGDALRAVADWIAQATLQ